MEYLTVWKIDIEADSPAEAARRAYEIMLDPASWATVFSVTDEQGNETEIDLREDN